MTRPSSTSFSVLVRLLYIQNPFYLIGTFLILFGLQQCFGRGDSLSASGMLVVLLAAYSLLLAGAATIIIRCGQVWEDARTILLVIVLLFFMLSASLDVHLLYMPLAGTFFLAAGLAFSLGLSEGLLRVLRIGLAARYRGPYYLILALLFLFPLAPAWLGYFGFYAARSWALLAFPSLAALALLTLLPAARTPAADEPATGTPWKWPYYPWSLFVYLTIGLAIRSWWLAYSFEPAKGEDGYFQPFFLLPLVLAWSALVLEIGKARQSQGAVAAGLSLPAVGLALGFLGWGNSPETIAFLERLAVMGTPAQLTVWSLLLYYAWAWLRRIPAAEGFLVGLLLLSSVVGRETFDWMTLSQPHPLPLAAVVGGLFLLAIWQHSSWRAIAASVMVLVGLGLTAGDVKTAISGPIWFWQWHAPLLALLAVATIFRDELARQLRELAWRAVPCLALVAAVVYPWTLPEVGASSLACYLGLLLLSSIGLWGRQKEVGPLMAASLTLGGNLLAHAQSVYWIVAQTELSSGLPWLTGGMAVVALAFVISLLKMGLWPTAGQWLVRTNLALGGTATIKRG
jgi:hypothetical protein